MDLRVKSKVEVPELIEKRRGQIIKAAIELFGKRGYHVTTIRDIAERANVSIGRSTSMFPTRKTFCSWRSSRCSTVTCAVFRSRLKAW